MRILERFNNNSVLCVDAQGREVVAIGTGIGFPSSSDEVPLERISRTFYGVDKSRLSLLDEIDTEVFELSAEVVDVARQILSYQLSPNTPFSLADHLAFAIQRARTHMVIRMPLAYDVQQSYPLEYRLGCYAVRETQAKLCSDVPAAEASGVALCLVNSATAPSSKSRSNDARREARTLEQLTLMVEHELDISVDRSGFEYARFATHVLYLLRRAEDSMPVQEENEVLYQFFSSQRPEIASCIEKLARIISEAYGVVPNIDEKLFLMMHVNRLQERHEDVCQ